MKLQQADYIAAQEIHKELLRLIPNDVTIAEFSKLLPAEAQFQRDNQEDEDEEYGDEYESEEDDKEEEDEEIDLNKEIENAEKAMLAAAIEDSLLTKEV